MPNLGETWAVLEHAVEPDNQTTNQQTEAVVIAIGPTIVRLVTRTGRRIAVPLRTWDRTWRHVRDAPLIPQTCAFCRQTAFFRYSVGEAPVWVCEDHVPQGARAYFADEPVNQAAAVLEQVCPMCQCKDVSVSDKLIRLSGTRTATHCTCSNCQVQWSPLIGRGLADDGATFASDLALMIDNNPGIFNIHVGFVLYRDLCRAIGMGQIQNFRSVPLQMKSAMGDALAVVFSRTGAVERAEVDTPRVFDFEPAEPPIYPGTPWVRRARFHASCNIDSIEGDLIFYHDEGTLRSSLRSDFLHHWRPLTGDMDSPPEKSLWRHVESREVVQVLRPTDVQSSNHQVPYLKRNGVTETTSTVTFSRLYTNVPAPVSMHLWTTTEGHLFEARQQDGVVLLRRLDTEEDLRTVELGEIYDNYEPVSFRERNENMSLFDPRSRIRSDSKWTDNTTLQEVVVIDIVVAGSKTFVQFCIDDARHFADQDTFVRNHTVVVDPSPCKQDETWVSQTDPNLHGVVIHPNEQQLGRAVIRWNNGTETFIAHDVLKAKFTKLEVRSYWEILNGSD